MPRLTEQEQQEIIRFIEADKPLPEKYRFLLFEDKREVELVWNGKTGDMCNIIMPFRTIEKADKFTNGSERVQTIWQGTTTRLRPGCGPRRMS